jgi:hypothetical protein
MATKRYPSVESTQWVGIDQLAAELNLSSAKAKKLILRHPWLGWRIRRGRGHKVWYHVSALELCKAIRSQPSRAHTSDQVDWFSEHLRGTQQ